MVSSSRLQRASLSLLALTLAASDGRPAAAQSHPIEPGEYLRAVVALQQADYPFAADHMLRALAADPSNRSLRRQTFVAATLAGRSEAARLASGLPDDPSASLLIANDAAIAGRWDDAAHLYSTLPHDGGLADVLRPVLVAWSLAGAGHTDNALQTLAPFIAGARLPGFYALHAGLIADLAGRNDDAATDLHLAQIDAAGLNLSLVRVLAGYAARHGHAQDGAALVHALVSAAPSLAIAETGIDTALADKPVATARDGLARAYRGVASLLTAQAQQTPAAGAASSQSGNTGALLMLRFSDTLDPKSSETALMIADADAALHAPASGLAALAVVAPNDPLAPLVELRKAELQQAAGNDDAARDLLEHLVAAYPKQPGPSRELGEILSDEHRYDEASASFSRAIGDIATPSGDDWQLFFDRAVALDRSHQWNRAEADLKHALALSPEQPFVLNYLGYSDAEQGRNLDAARRMLERALDQKPHDGAFLDSLGWIILKQGDTANAIDTLQQAAELTPEDPTVNYHLGVAYWNAGRKTEALDQWQRALILNPDPNDLPKIEARLKEADLKPAANTTP